jgi:predicted phosphodiesterase
MVDGYIFLGDYISDCPYPQRALNLIRGISKQYPSWIIRGNREDYQLKHYEEESDLWSYSSNTGSLLYTYENLTMEDFDFFQECEISKVISIDGFEDFTICHGSPTSNRELLHIGSEQSKQRLMELKTQLLVCAHTHIQGIYEYEGKTLINPGSVGIATGVAGQAQLAILHGDHMKWEPEFLSLDYDIKALIEEFNASDLPLKSKTFSKIIQYVLISGENILPDVYFLTEELTLKEYGNIPEGNLPDECWEQAFEQVVKSMNQRKRGTQ